LEFETIVFYALAVATVIPAFGVMMAKDIVRVAFWLLASLSGVAGLFIMLDADFLGVTQVLVYIGGILVLILFGIMMTHRDPVLVSADDDRRRSPFTGLLVSLMTFGALMGVILGTGWNVSGGLANGKLSGEPTAAPLGKALLTDYVLPFEIVSVLLLVVLCGAAYIARRGKDEEASNA
jgi:NADH-quinone oxidoreductase subunit J